MMGLFYESNVLNKVLIYYLYVFCCLRITNVNHLIVSLNYLIIRQISGGFSIINFTHDLDFRRFQIESF